MINMQEMDSTLLKGEADTASSEVSALSSCDESIIILNIGSGTKTSDSSQVVNIDWSVYLQLKKNPLFMFFIAPFLDKTRQARLKAIPDTVLVHDLRKGIPYADNSVDVVYHSHFLEHLDRESSEGFLLEVKRVLKVGGVHRIVVPDFEGLCRNYLQHLDTCEGSSDKMAGHDHYVEDIIEQMVRRESFGSSQQTPFRRALENFLMGDARKRGETHQWMYDRINLRSLLEKVGYKNVSIEGYDSSHVADWNDIGLDLNKSGEEYKPGSLYIEAFK